MKELETFKAIQEELIKEQQELLNQIIRFQNIKIRLLMDKGEIVPIAKGILKKTGKPCTIYGKPETTPQEINYGVKDLSEQYYLRQQKMMLDEAEANAIPKTEVNTEPEEPELDQSQPEQFIISYNEKGRKEITRKSI
jgi:hypothetical protein